MTKFFNKEHNTSNCPTTHLDQKRPLCKMSLFVGVHTLNTELTHAQSLKVPLTNVHLQIRIIHIQVSTIIISFVPTFPFYPPFKFHYKFTPYTTQISHPKLSLLFLPTLHTRVTHYYNIILFHYSSFPCYNYTVLIYCSCDHHGQECGCLCPSGSDCCRGATGRSIEDRSGL